MTATHQDTTIRDLVKASTWSAEKSGDLCIRSGYKPAAPTLAGLLLANADGSVEGALQQLCAIANVLRKIQQQEASVSKTDPAPASVTDLRDEVMP